MKKARAVYRGWRRKRNFVKLILTTETRLLKDIGLTPEIVYQRLNTPFWKIV